MVYDFSRIQLEQEMQKISELQIGLRGNSKQDCKSFLEELSDDVGIKILEESNNYYLFSVRPEDMDSYRDKLLLNLTGKSFKLELLKKEDLTLEQFFINRI